MQLRDLRSPHRAEPNRLNPFWQRSGGRTATISISSCKDSAGWEAGSRKRPIMRWITHACGCIGNMTINVYLSQFRLASGRQVMSYFPPLLLQLATWTSLPAHRILFLHFCYLMCMRDLLVITFQLLLDRSTPLSVLSDITFSLHGGCT